MRHTPEPWVANYNGIFRGYEHYQVFLGKMSGSGSECSPAKDEANAERVVACVNACAGMADPAAEIEAMRSGGLQWHSPDERPTDTASLLLALVRYPTGKVGYGPATRSRNSGYVNPPLNCVEFHAWAYLPDPAAVLAALPKPKTPPCAGHDAETV